MKTPFTKTILIVIITGIVVPAWKASAGEVGHYSPGVPNIRDFIVPQPGFYGVLYNYSYHTDQLNDASGNRTDSITIAPGGGPGTTLNLDVDVDLYAIAPAFIWVSKWKPLGARYAAYINPSFANSSVSASLTTAGGSGRSAETSQFDVGDLYVQPIWLGWGLPHCDLELGYGFYAPIGLYSTETVTLPVVGPVEATAADNVGLGFCDLELGYGFYAPIGRYNTETVTLPVVGPVKTTAADNIGLGFWTHQIGAGGTWYPWTNQATAVSAALTYEIHGEKDGFDLTPGQNLSLNWGISQFLPLKKDQSLLLEVGPSGYSSWQITDDSGSAASNPSVHDEVHAVGGQLGVSYVPWALSVNFRGLYEFAAVDRFQGWSIGLNIAKQF